MWGRGFKDSWKLYYFIIKLLSFAYIINLADLVCEVAADLTVVGDVEPVEFVQPVGDGLPVPAQWQVLHTINQLMNKLPLIC